MHIFIIYHLQRMQQNPLTAKNYFKCTKIRRNIRNEIFEKNRFSKELSYLTHYDEETRQAIKKSRDQPIPSLITGLNVLTVSYWRRTNKSFFKTRPTPESALDPHMTYQSLICLAQGEDTTSFDNWPGIVQIFEKELPQYLDSPYNQIKQMAIIVAGNRTIGKQPEILKMAELSDQNLWVLTNHVFEQKINFKALIACLNKEIPLAYRAIYELTNNEKDDIIFFIIESEQIVTLLIDNFKAPNKQIQAYSIRILGNILAEAEDYSADLTHYKIVDKIFPLLNSHDWELRRDCCWLIANYVHEFGAANQVICKPNYMQRLMIMFKSEQNPYVRTQLYFILSHLVMFGDQALVFGLALSQNFLQQCSEDMEMQQADLTINILNLIQNLIELGQRYSNTQQQQNGNQICRLINDSFFRLQIISKTYSQNRQISQLSQKLLQKINNQGNQIEHV